MIHNNNLQNVAEKLEYSIKAGSFYYSSIETEFSLRQRFDIKIDDQFARTTVISIDG